jgi:hypothetical protein
LEHWGKGRIALRRILGRLDLWEVVMVGVEWIFLRIISNDRLCVLIVWRACCRQYGGCVQQLLWRPGNSQQ